MTFKGPFQPKLIYDSLNILSNNIQTIKGFLSLAFQGRLLRFIGCCQEKKKRERKKEKKKCRLAETLMAHGILTLLFLTRCETRGILKMITSNSSYRETYNRLKNSLYSKMFHNHSVSKAEFVNITTALLTQRCAICFLEPIIFSTARTLSPTKPNPATSGPYQGPWMCSLVTILFPGLQIFAQVTWKPQTASMKTPNQTHLKGGDRIKSYHVLRKNH